MSGDGTTVWVETTVSDAATLSEEPSVRVCELHDSWRVLPAMTQPRRGPAATRLPDGTVLVLGGRVSTCSAPTVLAATATAERFDPETNSWTRVADMPQPRRGHGVLSLDNGDVLVVGGLDGDGARIAETTRYDLATASWEPGPPLPIALGPARVQQNGDLLLVLGDDGAFRWHADGWVAVASDANAGFEPAWPWGDGVIIAMGGARARIYDPRADAWSDGPTGMDGRGEGWKTGLSWWLNTSTLLDQGDLFALATTAGFHGEIGQQGVAIRLLRGSDTWLPGAAGPFWGDGNMGSAIGFAPGRALAVPEFAQRGSVYDATLDAWCYTAEAPVGIRGVMLVLMDSSVLLTGDMCGDNVPLRWMPS